MSNKQLLDYGLARRLAIEQQLLAEEKWVVEALKNIKKQRNSLQIEKLHLTSQLGKIMMKKRGGDSKIALSEKEISKQEVPAPVPELPSFSMDDEVCNAEELNLTVPQHTYHHPTNAELAGIEEFENGELDYEIDINMLMSGLDGEL